MDSVAATAAETRAVEICHTALDEKYRTNLWGWLSKQCRTQDEHDHSGVKAKPFPVHKDYIRAYYEIWKGDDPTRPPWLITDKPRQYVISWADRAFNVHECQYKNNRRAGVQSKSETDSDAQLRRAWFIYENQDAWVKKLHPAKLLTDPLRIEWEVSGSVFVSVPKGVNQARQYTWSSLTIEEAAYAEHLDMIRTACWPALFGGGRYSEITTANPGDFQELHDSIRDGSIEHRTLMGGVQMWRKGAVKVTQSDGTEIELKYPLIAVSLDVECDPSPETQEKVALARATMSKPLFAKEYLRDYVSLSGQRVWSELTPEIHGFEPGAIQLNPAWRRVRVIDHGFQNPTACLWAAITEPGWRGCMEPITRTPLSVLIFYREFYQAGWNVKLLADAIKTRSAGESYYTTLIDPSTKAHRGNEAAGQSVFQMFQSEGIYVVEANNAVTAGLDQVRRRLMLWNNQPAILISLELTNTWREWQGYRYKERPPAQAGLVNQPEEVRKVNDHTCDCGRYVCAFDPMPDLAVPAPPGPGTFGGALAMLDIEQESKQATAYSYLPSWTGFR